MTEAAQIRYHDEANESNDLSDDDHDFPQKTATFVPAFAGIALWGRNQKANGKRAMSSASNSGSAASCGGRAASFTSPTPSLKQDDAHSSRERPQRARARSQVLKNQSPVRTFTPNHRRRNASPDQPVRSILKLPISQAPPPHPTPLYVILGKIAPARYRSAKDVVANARNLFFG